MFVFRALFWLSAMALVVPHGSAPAMTVLEGQCTAGTLACDGPVAALGEYRDAAVDRVLAFKRQRQEARRLEAEYLAEREGTARPGI